jgi:hypothetical protein
MVMTMGLLGREERRNIVHLSIFHVLGAALGGAMTGGVFGAIGWLLSLSTGHTEIIIGVTVLALWQSVTGRPARLGLQRQVPRLWLHTMVPELCYFLWGMLLGSGIATVIPYSAFFVFLATQLVSGFVLGCATGALFGGIRQLVALLPLLREQYRLHPEKAGMLMSVLARPVSVLNILWIIGGSLLLLATSWH